MRRKFNPNFRFNVYGNRVFDDIIGLSSNLDFGTHVKVFKKKEIWFML